MLTPAVLAFGRHVEHEADRFGLEITRDNHDCATAFVKLQQENLAVPRPGLLYKLWRSEHPPLGERIDFCNEYRPWETGAAAEVRRADPAIEGTARLLDSAEDQLADHPSRTRWRRGPSAGSPR